MIMKRQAKLGGLDWKEVEMSVHTLLSLSLSLRVRKTNYFLSFSHDTSDFFDYRRRVNNRFSEMGFEQSKVVEVLKRFNWRKGNKERCSEDEIIGKLIQ
jgi:hypothetical protein